MPSYIFFPDEPRPKADPYAGKTYRDWCETCPVRIKCRESAYLHDMQGIWGGLSDAERKAKQPAEDREELRECKGAMGEYWPLYGHS